MVVVAEEDRFAVVAPLDHMQGLAFNEIPSEPRHATPKSAATLHDAPQVPTLTPNLLLQIY
jgi:hypothetical protein